MWPAVNNATARPQTIRDILFVRIIFRFHVIQAEFLVLFICSLVLFFGKVRIVVGRVRILNEAVVVRVVCK